MAKSIHYQTRPLIEVGQHSHQGTDRDKLAETFQSGNRHSGPLGHQQVRHVMNIIMSLTTAVFVTQHQSTVGKCVI